jgi:hypothetical protein
VARATTAAFAPWGVTAADLKAFTILFVREREVASLERSAMASFAVNSIVILPFNIFSILFLGFNMQSLHAKRTIAATFAFCKHYFTHPQNARNPRSSDLLELARQQERGFQGAGASLRSDSVSALLLAISLSCRYRKTQGQSSEAMTLQKERGAE